MSKKMSKNQSGVEGTSEKIYALAKDLTTMEQDESVEVSEMERTENELRKAIHSVLTYQKEQELDAAFNKAVANEEHDVFYCIRDISFNESQTYLHEDGSVSRLVLIPLTQIYPSTQKPKRNPTFKQLQEMIRLALLEEEYIFTKENFYLSNIAMTMHEAQTETISGWHNLLSIIALESEEASMKMGKTLPFPEASNNFEILYLTGIIKSRPDEYLPITDEIDAEEMSANYLKVLAQYVGTELNDKYAPQMCKWDFMPPMPFDRGLDDSIKIRDDNILRALFETFAGRNDLHFTLFKIEGMDNEMAFTIFDDEQMQAMCMISDLTSTMGHEEMFDYMLQQINFYEIDKLYIMEDLVSLDTFESEYFRVSHFLLRESYELENTEKTERSYMH
jgi:hypothetical protein